MVSRQTPVGTSMKNSSIMDAENKSKRLFKGFFFHGIAGLQFYRKTAT
jgi:hypothetical protein